MSRLGNLNCDFFLFHCEELMKLSYILESYFQYSTFTTQKWKKGSNPALQTRETDKTTVFVS